MEEIRTMDVGDESGETEGVSGLVEKIDNDDRKGSPSRQHKVTRWTVKGGNVECIP